MTRRGFLLSGASLLATCGPSLASTAEDEVAARLRRDGYRILMRKRTWLGRIRFKARKGQTVREVVVDPTSGEVLRDYSDKLAGADKESNGGNSSSGGAAGGGGTEGGEGGSGGEEGGGEEGGGEEASREEASREERERESAGGADAPR